MNLCLLMLPSFRLPLSHCSNTIIKCFVYIIWVVFTIVFLRPIIHKLSIVVYFIILLFTFYFSQSKYLSYLLILFALFLYVWKNFQYNFQQSNYVIQHFLFFLGNFPLRDGYSLLWTECSLTCHTACLSLDHTDAFCAGHSFHWALSLVS